MEYLTDVQVGELRERLEEVESREASERLMVAIKAVADYICVEMQNEARAGAPWQDRTGNARSGLFAVAEMAAKDIIDLYLSHGHTVFYGRYLELNHGQQYAIVMPAILANLPELEKMLGELLR